MEFSVDEEGVRLDQFLAARLEERFSRSAIQRWIKDGMVRVSSAKGDALPDRKIKPSLLLGEGQRIVIGTATAGDADIKADTRTRIEPVAMEFPVLYEDEHLAVIIKPPGISVHPGPGERHTVTLLNGLVHRWPQIASIDAGRSAHPAEPGDMVRPGIVHRLDRATEGVMVIARNTGMQWKLSRLFQKREVKKEYLAWLCGAPPESAGRIEASLRRHPHDRMRMQVHPDGRLAITEFSVQDVEVSRKGRKFTLVDINLLTGRTHQIRAHFAHLKCPVVGDDLYSSSAKEFSQFGLLLLSRRLAFRHPATGEELSFEAPLPERFLEFARKCTFF